MQMQCAQYSEPCFHLWFVLCVMPCQYISIGGKMYRFIFGANIVE